MSADDREPPGCPVFFPPISHTILHTQNTNFQNKLLIKFFLVCFSINIIYIIIYMTLEEMKTSTQPVF